MPPEGRVETTVFDGPSPIEGFILSSPDGRVTASVAAGQGATLSSIEVADFGELLYRANDFSPVPPGEWTGRAPLLWPAVGRNFTPQALAADEPDCCFEHNGVVYDLPIHGFARDQSWHAIATKTDAGGAEVTLELTDDESTRAIYPWPFEVRMTHRVEPGGLRSWVTVRSPEPLWFCIGNHLTINLPAGRYDEVTVASNATRRLELDEHSLLSGEETPIDLTAGEPLAQDWLLDGVFGGIDGPPQMTVRWPDGRTVTVGQEALEGNEYVAPEDWLFVVYGNRERAYYCPEPWVGRPNGLQDGRGVVKLPAETSFTWQMSVTIGA